MNISKVMSSVHSTMTTQKKLCNSCNIVCSSSDKKLDLLSFAKTNQHPPLTLPILAKEQGHNNEKASPWSPSTDPLYVWVSGQCSERQETDSVRYDIPHSPCSRHSPWLSMSMSVSVNVEAAFRNGILVTPAALWRRCRAGLGDAAYIWEN